MSDPMSDVELEARLIYSCIVAGKSAKFTEGVIQRFFPPAIGPFDFIRSLLPSAAIGPTLRMARSGNYTKLEECFRQLVRANLDLRTCAPEQLEAIHGIGPKTSRFFILWTRPGARYAALDVHVLRWLRRLGYDAPRSTPSGAKYRELELIFLNEAESRGMSPRELDAQIWAEGSGYQETHQTP